MLDPFSLFQLGTTAVGVIGGLTGSKRNEQKRIEEEYNRKANAKLETAYDANAALSPGATARAAKQGVSSAQQAAVGSAMNAAAGNAASSGDFSNAMGAGIAGSQAAQAASAPFAAQMAGIEQQRMAQEQQKVGTMADIANSQANLSNHVSYVNEQNQANPWLNALEGAVGGANAGNTLYSGLFNSLGSLMGGQDPNVSSSKGWGGKGLPVRKRTGPGPNPASQQGGW